MFPTKDIVGGIVILTNNTTVIFPRKDQSVLCVNHS